MSGNVNYSLERLVSDETDRAHITEQLRLLRRTFAIEGKKVVEFGCGFGHNLELFRDANEVVGLEGLAAAVEKAQAAGLDVRYCDLNGPTALPDGYFDVALCLDVLEHLNEPLVALTEIKRTLKSGGIAILNVPNHFDLAGRMKIMLGRSLDTHNFFPEHDEWNNPHIRFFTNKGFVRLVELSGLRILENRSGEIFSYPFQARIGKAFFKGWGARLAAKLPGLFAAGHFMIARKAD
ncbi:MAG: class I SAM-dependent methyltransferase [Sphingomonas sp.]|nr:class I SAM-dependent methyltransferase [Sphingomonas sp.]